MKRVMGLRAELYEGSDATLGMTPSTMKAGGKGETIRYALADSALGRMLVAATARGLCSVAFAADNEALLNELVSRYPHAAVRRADSEMSEYVRGVAAHLVENPKAEALPLDVRMTAFQQRVWQALRAIPRGETTTYGAIAEGLGMPKGAQAVGQAIGSNPLAVLIPCHRVVGARGKITGYRWGLERKEKLLAGERAEPA